MEKCRNTTENTWKTGIILPQLLPALQPRDHRGEAPYIPRPAAGLSPSKTAESCRQAGPSKRTFQKRAAASEHRGSSPGIFSDNRKLPAEPLGNNNKEEQSERLERRESPVSPAALTHSLCEVYYCLKGRNRIACHIPALQLDDAEREWRRVQGK